MAAALIARFGKQICEKAVCLRTSVPKRIALMDVGLPVVVRRFIEQFDPAATIGLVRASAEVCVHSAREMHDTLLTSATGSGKSLALWDSWCRPSRRETIPQPWRAFLLRLCCGDRLSGSGGLQSQTRWLSIRGSVMRERFRLGRDTLSWTAWHGVSDSVIMARHEKSDSFRQARIRLTTVDKVHWSLMKEHAYFLSRLTALALDEAHVWQGQWEPTFAPC